MAIFLKVLMSFAVILMRSFWEEEVSNLYKQKSFVWWQQFLIYYKENLGNSSSFGGFPENLKRPQSLFREYRKLWPLAANCWFNKNVLRTLDDEDIAE